MIRCQLCGTGFDKETDRRFVFCPKCSNVLDTAPSEHLAQEQKRATKPVAEVINLGDWKNLPSAQRAQVRAAVKFGTLTRTIEDGARALRENLRRLGLPEEDQAHYERTLDRMVESAYRARDRKLGLGA